MTIRYIVRNTVDFQAFGIEGYYFHCYDALRITGMSLE
jgi:hypothetical protein